MLPADPRRPAEPGRPARRLLVPSPVLAARPAARGRRGALRDDGPARGRRPRPRRVPLPRARCRGACLGGRRRDPGELAGGAVPALGVRARRRPHPDGADPRGDGPVMAARPRRPRPRRDPVHRPRHALHRGRDAGPTDTGRVPRAPARPDPDGAVRRRDDRVEHHLLQSVSKSLHFGAGGCAPRRGPSRPRRGGHVRTSANAAARSRAAPCGILARHARRDALRGVRRPRRRHPDQRAGLRLAAADARELPPTCTVTWRAFATSARTAAARCPTDPDRRAGLGPRASGRRPFANLSAGRHLVELGAEHNARGGTRSTPAAPRSPTGGCASRCATWRASASSTSTAGSSVGSSADDGCCPRAGPIASGCRGRTWSRRSAARSRTRVSPPRRPTTTTSGGSSTANAGSTAGSASTGRRW